MPSSCRARGARSWRGIVARGRRGPRPRGRVLQGVAGDSLAARRSRGRWRLRGEMSRRSGEITGETAGAHLGGAEAEAARDLGLGAACRHGGDEHARFVGALKAQLEARLGQPQHRRQRLGPLPRCRRHRCGGAPQGHCRVCRRRLGSRCRSARHRLDDVADGGPDVRADIVGAGPVHAGATLERERVGTRAARWGVPPPLHGHCAAWSGHLRALGRTGREDHISR